MRVADLMHTDIKTVFADSTVAEAIVTLADAHVSGVPVVDAHGRLVGVLSSSDVIQAEAEASDKESRVAVLEDTRAEDLMNPRPITVTADTDIREAARQMLYADVKRLFVEHETKLVGVISQSDIVGAVASGKL
jgi:CBS domain-containing protein